MTILRDLDQDLVHFRVRVFVMGLVILFAFSLLLARLVYLQVFEHENLYDQAESNRLAFIPSVPSRGLIYDRNGLVLTYNVPAYTLEITPSKITDLNATIAELSKIVSIQPRDIKRFNRLLEESKSFEPVAIRTQLNDEEMAHFAAQSFRFPGVEMKARLLRTYPYGELASHLIGYIGRINTSEKEKIAESEDGDNYRGTDYIGKVGIERTYEKDLHGITGLEQVETTAGGQAVRKLTSSPATPGASLHLSIDLKLQKMVEDLFGTRRGALVAIDPRNGEVLAMVSKPTFDPNIFLDGIDVESWKSLNESLSKPLLNRALRGTYPPGSTYKPFMAMAALETSSRSPDKLINDTGIYQFGNHKFRGHAVGTVNMFSSIVHSSNAYYYSLANEMGVEKMYNFMKPIGFGQLTGIDLNGELRGVLPNQEWKRKTFKKPEQQDWMAGETISLGIGQGYNSFTPLQLAVGTSILANGGKKFKPHIVMAQQDGITRQSHLVNLEPPLDLGFKPEHVDLVRRAMAGVAKSGTSAGVFARSGYVSAGKTGTAQAVTIGQNEKYNAARLTEYQRDHSLYIAFAPLENPKIALAVIVENAGFGATSAAPIARRVFDYWLLGQYPSVADVAAVRTGRGSAPIGKPRKVSEIDVLTAPQVAFEKDAADAANGKKGDKVTKSEKVDKTEKIGKTGKVNSANVASDPKDVHH